MGEMGSMHKGKQRGNWLTEQYSCSAVVVCIAAHVYLHLMNVVFSFL